MSDEITSETSQETGTSESTNHLADATARAMGETTEATAPESRTSQVTQTSAPSLTDIDKLEKFVWQGKVYTAKELKEGWLRQQDYTKKTKELSEQTKSEERYWQNLRADLGHIRKNPALALKFKQVYPAKFHSLVDEIFESASGQGNQTQTTSSLDPRVLAQLEEPLGRMNKLLETYQEREVAAIESELSGYEAKFTAKYPLAQENEVLAKAEYLIQKQIDDGEQSPKLDEASWDKLWKQSHDYHDKRYKDFYQRQVSDQRAANKQASDVPRGGSSAARPAEERAGLKSGRAAMEAEIARMRG